MSKLPVMLHIRGTQNYQDQEPEVIELTTEGTLEKQKEVWEISYEESDLTGLAGVTTTFRVGPRGVVLKRTGAIENQMIFMEGRKHESLYRLDFGALMLTVKATKVESNVTETGGTVDIHYNIEIEDTNAGMVEYHIEVSPIS